MAQAKEKVVFTAEPAQIQHMQKQVKSGRYRSASEFMREAIDEKLARLRRERLAEQVTSYCSEAGEVDDPQLVGIQAFDDKEEER